MIKITPLKILCPVTSPGGRCNFFIAEEAIQYLTHNTLDVYD